MYIHERDGWPALEWDQPKLGVLVSEVRHRQGRLLGRMEALGFELRDEATLRSLTQDVVKTSEIEGETLDVEQVRSSIARKLGMDLGVELRVGRNVEGIVEVLLDATGKPFLPLTPERLFGWHAALFPTGRSGLERIVVGGWRGAGSGPMQVVSGPIGREWVHYEAPAHERLEGEMARFLEWFNGDVRMDPVVKSALAHFWFVTIHPFEDGNGRIARAIADMQLARSEGSSRRFYSMSAQIQRERKAYYTVLETCQKGSLDVSPWIEWYMRCLKTAIAASEITLETVLGKARFWKSQSGQSLNERQRTMLNRLLDGFEGKLTSSKWASLLKCSQDTALRDLSDLVARGMLRREDAGGRSTHYQLQLPKATIHEPDGIEPSIKLE